MVHVAVWYVVCDVISLHVAVCYVLSLHAPFKCLCYVVCDMRSATPSNLISLHLAVSCVISLHPPSNLACFAFTGHLLLHGTLQL